ncbi:hypothetical protein SAMN05216228_102731 [Rhizobium tibeticum]|uniref:Uncharacterized protein n=1 Tax=Rhizobium tibeticum TaxID=501024 RepID=A0A1H8T345_9HYPH|nr:hypothetical protein [Rhizobium tibeticum]SEI14358.1 hypothetical protein RTCCBAU85039_5076 [Rhizobium tibeticum]SEO85430.1 hypothetical protein SAMN05216228_102731 [Rhizobium tibeticum]
MEAITLLASTVGIYLILLPVVAELKQPTTYDDRPMACAAFYQYLARASKDAGDDADSDRYMAKFKVLYDQGVANVLAVGGTREQARKATQNFVDIIGEMAISRPEAVPSLIAMCKREYP